MIDGLIPALVLCSVFISLLLLFEIAVRRNFASPDVTRRVSHVAAGLFAIYIYITFSPTVFLVCTILLLSFIGISYYFKYFRSIHAVERRTIGEVFLPLGILLSFAICGDNTETFVASVLIVTLADAAAGITGDLRGNMRASRLGSIMFFVITLTILVLVIESSAHELLIIAYALTIVEKISPLGSDNIFIPLTASVLLLL